MVASTTVIIIIGFLIYMVLYWTYGKKIAEGRRQGRRQERAALAASLRRRGLRPGPQGGPLRSPLLVHRRRGAARRACHGHGLGLAPGASLGLVRQRPHRLHPRLPGAHGLGALRRQVGAVRGHGPHLEAHGKVFLLDRLLPADPRRGGLRQRHRLHVRENALHRVGLDLHDLRRHHPGGPHLPGRR